MTTEYFQINDWILSVDENKLYRKNREVSVEPRLINLLHFLTINAGEVYDRQKLIEHVWSSAVVTDQVVTQSIFSLRKILRDGREENINYVVTVPKRGYKLVAHVARLTPEEANLARKEGLSLSQEEVESVGRDSYNERVSDEIELQGKPLDADHDFPEEESQPMAFPAAPLTRAVAQKAKRKAEKSKRPKSWKVHFVNALLISFIVIAMGYFTYRQSGLEISQAIDAHLVEFRYEQSFDSDELSHQLSGGICQKLMMDITEVTPYRVRLDKDNAHTDIIAGITVTVSVHKRDSDGDGNIDGHFLDVEYKNNSSGKIVFKRQYSLSKKHLHSVLRQADIDIMKVLKVEEPEKKADMLMRGLPSKPQAIEDLILANHYLNTSEGEDFQKGIDLLELVLQNEPNNRLTQAELLIAYHVQQALTPEIKLNQQRITSLSTELVRSQEGAAMQMQPRVYEALALHYIYIDELKQAKVYLKKAQSLRHSVLSYVLQGKLAELNGHSEDASVAYSEAFYKDMSIETYMLCQKLLFSSDIKTINYELYRSVHPAANSLL